MKQSFSTVEEVLENYKTSVSERDVEKFLRSYSENINLYDCWGKWDCKLKKVNQWLLRNVRLPMQRMCSRRLKYSAKLQIDLRLGCARWMSLGKLYTNILPYQLILSQVKACFI